jgi:hypothetical protein
MQCRDYAAAAFVGDRPGRAGKRHIVIERLHQLALRHYDRLCRPCRGLSGTAVHMLGVPHAALAGKELMAIAPAPHDERRFGTVPITNSSTGENEYSVVRPARASIRRSAMGRQIRTSCNGRSTTSLRATGPAYGPRPRYQRVPVVPQCEDVSLIAACGLISSDDFR